MRMCVFMMMAAAAAGAAPGVSPNGLVVLLTDYNDDSAQIGALKGVVYHACHEARVDSITHAAARDDAAAAAYLLMETCREFPPGTVFCCVVGARGKAAPKPVAVVTQLGHFLVGPDNGVLTVAANRYGALAVHNAVNRALWREGKLTHAYQGRDVFGPLAGALAAGTPIDELGPALDRLAPLDVGAPRIEDGAIHGVVTRKDAYGNLVTNITAQEMLKLDFREGSRARVTIGGAAMAVPLVRTYGSVEEGERLGLLDSAGFMKFAINMGNLAEAIGEQEGAPVTIERAD